MKPSLGDFRRGGGFVPSGLVVSLWLFFAATFLRADVLVSEDSEWRYFKGVIEASSPDPAAWRLRDFNDGSWSVGRGPFYYEDSSGFTGNTALTDMRGRYSCVFLRKLFSIANPAAVSELTLVLQADDGAVVWLNGVEVGRVNMPEGEPTVGWTSLPSAGEPNLATFILTNAASLLRAGGNLLAVQAFNASLTDSTDFLIAASLSGNLDVIAPAIQSVIPAPGARVRSLANVEVVFTENVMGVTAQDLLVNGTPAIGLTAHSPRDYTFTFAEPGVGSVLFTWASGHGIVDLAVPGNAFVASGWDYVLDPLAPLADVVISEFLADNANGLRDDLGNRSDWIELLNRSDAPADLDGWYLTDERAVLTKWRFPAVTIPARSFLLVWASNANRTNPAAPLHTNFKLANDGEYLGLVNPFTNIVSEFAPAYLPQRPDVSFGRDRTSPDLVGFYATPTPGTTNLTRGAGFAPAVVVSVPGGVYTNALLLVALSSPGGTLRFTTDGTVPTATSARYTSPVLISRSTVLMARVFEDGLLPGPIAVEAYTLLDAGVATFSSNLPLLVLHTGGRGVFAETRTPAYVTAIDTERGRASFRTSPSLLGRCQLELRGQSSLGFPKVSYNLELNDAEGNDLEAPLLGLPSESDWVLYSPYSDKPFLQNFLAYELFTRMGHYAPRCRFVELFVDTSGAAFNRLDGSGDYAGIYILMEKIKVDAHRVDMARLSPQQNTEPEISGGYIFKKDKDSPGDLNFGTQGGAGFGAQALKIHEPKPREVTSAQMAWLRNYIIQFERALYAQNWLTATGTNHYSHYIDIDSFVDFHWIVEFPKQIDGYRLSNYMSKDRNGTLRMGPVWDWNLSFGNADYADGMNTSGYYYSVIGENDHIWLRRLMCGTIGANGTTGDPDFNQRIADRWSVLRTNILSSTNLLRRIDELAAYLDEAQVRDFARWPRLGTYIWPNPPLYSTPTTYAGIIANMKSWVRARYTWIDGQFLKVPQFSRADSGVSPGFPLTLSAPVGSVYYTTDGSDPRAPGGGISSRARQFSTNILIQATSRIVARARNGSRWSGPAAATYSVEPPRLVLTEVMYAPERRDLAITDPSPFEYLELKNEGDQALDLRGFQFVGGIRFTFPTNAPVLAPGARVVVARDPVSLEARHGDIGNLVGPYVGSLANEGERVTLLGPMQETVLEFSYDPDWYPATDGLGFALVPVTEGAPRDALARADGWRPGSRGGTPGRGEDPSIEFPQVMINEVLTHTDPPLVGSIELFNPGPAEADIGGWFLSDDRLQLKFRIPFGTRLGPGAYVVFTERDFNVAPGVPPSFNLRASGDEVFLTSADTAGQPTGYQHGFDFGAALNGVSFGRHVNSTGEEQFVAQATRSLGLTNSAPLVGPIVISEIMYHPPDVLTNNASWDNTEDEFVELVNISPLTVLLFDPNAPTNTWRLRDAVDYTFPTSQSLNPGARLLVVSFDPVADPVSATAFRARYQLSESIRLLGPFSGKLANQRDSVELIQPDLVRFYGTNEVRTSVLVDRVAFHDTSPWPVGADGVGPSLQRRVEAAYGNDPANWVAASPTPGQALVAGVEPVITTPPASQAAKPGTTVVFNVTASGPGPLRYQWRHNGENLPDATQSSILLTNVQPDQGGAYQVIVSTSSRWVASPEASLTVGVPPILLLQPASREVQPGEIVTLSTLAVGRGQLRYQWRHRGSPIPDATGSSYQLPAAESGVAGPYDVQVTDDTGLTATSATAILTVAGDPAADRDGDGMPDVWETANGLDARSAADAALDSDQDRASNLQEYLAGTNPRDPDSVLKIRQLDVVGRVAVRFRGLDNRSYTVLFRDRVHSQGWQVLGEVPSLPGGTGAVREVELVDPSPRVRERYYRLMTPALGGF